MFKTSLTLSFVLAIALVWSSSTISAYQDQGPARVQGQSSSARSYGVAKDLYSEAPSAKLGLTSQSPFARRSRRANPMDEAVEAMKKAESDEDRRDAEAKVRELLAEQYQAFLVENEKQIEQLQKRLNDLKEQLDRRRRAQDKMVDLEMKRVINESEGLVWPNRSSRRSGGPMWRNSDPFSAKSFPAPAQTRLPGVR